MEPRELPESFGSKIPMMSPRDKFGPKDVISIEVKRESLVFMMQAKVEEEPGKRSPRNSIL